MIDTDPERDLVIAALPADGGWLGHHLVCRALPGLTRFQVRRALVAAREAGLVERQEVADPAARWRVSVQWRRVPS